MRTVAIERVVAQDPGVVARTLDPESIVEYEGSFSVVETETRESDSLVVVSGRGLTFTLRVESLDSGLYYEQYEGGGPLESMATTIFYEPADDGTRIDATSEVDMGLPVKPLTDRLAAWKRKGELRRALDSIAEDVS